ncbi:MAG: SRPBCC family protein [Bacteroidota bacterium]
MEFRFEIDNTPEEVFRYLSDMPSFVSVHPLIYRIKSLPNGNHLIHEKIKLGPIPYRFTYPVIVHADEAKGEVQMFATIKKMIFVNLEFKILAAGDKTIVEEKASVRSVLPVKGILRRIFARQHKRMFDNMGS